MKNSTINKYFGIVCLVPLLMLVGCASVTSDIKVQSEINPEMDISQFKSYAWLGSAAIVNDPKGQWEPPDFDSDAELKFLIDQQLRTHGFVESSANPDLIAAFAAGIDMGALKLKEDQEKQLKTLKNVPQGALLVVLVESSTGNPVWAGIAVGEIQDNPTSDIVRKRLSYAVNEMFKTLAK